MKILLIINPKAGNGRGAKIGEFAQELFTERGVSFDLVYTEYPGHAVALARDAEGYATVCSVGGDGTVFEVANGLIKAGKAEAVTLGVVPVGTGNSFSQDLGVHNDVTAAVEAIVNGRSKHIDVGRFSTGGESYYFLNVLGFGFVADVAAAASRYKAVREASYAIGVVQITATLSHYELELTVDGKKYHRDNCFVEICNSRYTGGNMLIAPDAKIDDGLLDVVLLDKISRWRLLKAFPLVFKGEHAKVPQTEFLKGKEITARTNIAKILTPDGEIFGSTPVEVTVQPKLLKVHGLWNT